MLLRPPIPNPTAYPPTRLLLCRLLADVYCINGVEHSRYHHAVGHILGRTGAIGVSVFQLLNIFLIDIAYTITGGEWRCVSECVVWRKTELLHGSVDWWASESPAN